jgi:alkaline phosphatase D
MNRGPHLDLFMLDMRQYRGANGPNTQTELTDDARILGRTQAEWLKQQLAASRATWKVIAADMPLGLIVYHDFVNRAGSEAVAQADGPPLGRELEIASMLAFIRHAGIRNTVWITADMHYTAAHYYDPNQAVFQDFEPFWEFVSGPLHAGTWGPSPLDNTFGPRAVFEKGCTAEQGENLPPCFGLQFFGHVAIDGASEVMTVTLKDVNDRNLWSVAMEPKFNKWSRGLSAQRLGL